MCVCTIQELQELAIDETAAQRPYVLVRLKFHGVEHAHLFEGATPNVIRERIKQALEKRCSTHKIAFGDDCAMIVAPGMKAHCAKSFSDALSNTVARAVAYLAPAVKTKRGFASSPRNLGVGNDSVWRHAIEALRGEEAARGVVGIAHAFDTRALMGPYRQGPNEGGPGVLAPRSPKGPDLSAGNARRLGD